MNMRNLRLPVLIAAIILITLVGSLRQRQILEELRSEVAAQKQTGDVAETSNSQIISALTPSGKNSPDQAGEADWDRMDFPIIGEMRESFDQSAGGMMFSPSKDLENRINSLDVATLKQMAETLEPDNSISALDDEPPPGMMDYLIESELLDRLVEADPAYVLGILGDESYVSRSPTMSDAIRYMAQATRTQRSAG